MLLLDVRDPDTKQLLFQYDPVNEVIWVKRKNCDLVQVHLHLVKARNAVQIETYLSTLSTNPGVP